MFESPEKPKEKKGGDDKAEEKPAILKKPSLSEKLEQKDKEEAAKAEKEGGKGGEAAEAEAKEGGAAEKKEEKKEGAVEAVEMTEIKGEAAGCTHARVQPSLPPASAATAAPPSPAPSPQLHHHHLTTHSPTRPPTYRRVV